VVVVEKVLGDARYVLPRYLGIFDPQRTRSITVPRHVLRRQVVHELRLLDVTSAKDITKRERS
jgi:hypothetical protein